MSSTLNGKTVFRTFCTYPAKAATSLGATRDIPLGLENGVYFNDLSVRCEQLIFTLSAKSFKKCMLNTLFFYFPVLVNSIAPKDILSPIY